MDSPQLFISFGAVMLVVALLGVAIDWFGKPLRHRRFVPKIYRFPDERQPRRSKVRATDWSETSMVLPVVEAPAENLIRYPDPLVGNPAQTFDPPQLAPGPGDVGPATAQVPVIDLEGAANDTFLGSDDRGLVTLEDTNPDAELIEETKANNRGSRDDRKQGWTIGDYIFNFDADGAEPRAATVQERYWKNVATTAGAATFGDANIERMGEGRSPQRRNRRTGRIESMRLPNVNFEDTDGQTPVPTWPGTEIDPFK
jgi:hypothetical protein